VLTNQEFARLAGCSFTMSSKIRNGKRMPSGALFTRIVRVFDLDADEAVAAYAGGNAVFAEFVERKVFKTPVHHPAHPTHLESA
jgi:transcriptional regulator with XRE-family HTH domain